MTILKQKERQLKEALDALNVFNQELEERVRQRTQDLAASQYFLERILDTSPNMIYIHDLQENHLVFVNQAALNLLGYSSAEMIAMGASFVERLIHPDDLPHILKLIEQQTLETVRDDQVFATEYRVRDIQGNWRWFISHESVFTRAADGKIKQIIGNAQDISDRKHTEAILEFQAHILQATHDAVISTDLDGLIQSWNCGAEKIFGYTAAEAIGQNVSILYEDPRELQSKVLKPLLANGSHELEMKALSKSGEAIDVSLRLSILQNEQGNILALIGCSNDISDRKQYELQLQKTNEELMIATRLKDEFLANMSHELRTPLNAILGMTEGLQERVLGEINQQQLNALNIIEHSGQHLLSLITDILDVAKIASGQMTLNIMPTDIALLCQASLTFIKPQALKKNLKLEIKLPQNLPELLVDERRIRQVLINLLNNAVKFTPNNGRITLGVKLRQPPKSSDLADSQQQNHLCIAVSDTGIGIAPENLKKLFQPFIQIDASLNRQYEGTGLGLTIVKQIVELHGGSINVDSELGAGSCFKIDLPYNSLSSFPKEMETPAEVSVRANLEQSGSFPLILIAEDNEANIITVLSYLEAKGYRVIIANNGEEAVSLARTEKPDIILMDIQMPGMDGLAATKKIREDPEIAHIPIIALTALAMSDDRERCLAAGANDYLSKPVKLKQLANIIQSFLPQ